MTIIQDTTNYIGCISKNCHINQVCENVITQPWVYRARVLINQRL